MIGLTALAAWLGGALGCGSVERVNPMLAPAPAGGGEPVGLAAVTAEALPAGWRRETATRADAPAELVCREAGGAETLPLPGEPAAPLNVAVQVRVEPGGEETAGLLFGRGSAARAYLARLNSRVNNVRLYRLDDGHTALLAGRDLAVPVGQWHTLRVYAAAEQISVELDGEPLLAARDGGRQGGGLALWAAPGTSACFGAPAPRDSLDWSRTSSLQE